jgi:hypothetical protein
MPSRYICPVCRCPRDVHLSDALSLSFHLRLITFLSALALVLWVWGGWEQAAVSVFLYLPIWSLAEFLHWARVRQAAKCSQCDFDPILYRKDWKAARLRVETKLKSLERSNIDRLQTESGNIRATAKSAAAIRTNEKNSPSLPR